MSDEWIGITDDDLPSTDLADSLLLTMRDYGSGQAELSGYDNEDDERKRWTLAVFDLAEPVAVHVDWREQTVIAAVLRDMPVPCPDCKGKANA